MRDDAIFVEEDYSRLEAMGYGVVVDDALRLDPVEALYLTYIGEITVYSNSNILDFESLVKILHSKDPLLWVKFTVYYDLRSRGRVVRPGVTDNSLLLYSSKKSTRAEIAIYVVEEAKIMKLRELVEWIRSARMQGRTTVLAVVDKHGDVTYYETSIIEPLKKVG